MSAVEKAFKRLERREREAVRKFWRIEKEIKREDRKLKQRNVFHA